MDMLKSMLADVSSVSPSSEQSGLWVRREFVCLILSFFVFLLLLLFFVCSPCCCCSRLYLLFSV